MKIENKNYKDTVFRLLFNNKEHLLELYNALNSTNYTNPEDLEITTLEGHTFLNMKNDVSFVLNFELNLYEHQSTICPNIPLRNLYYVSELLLKLVPRTLTYSSERILIPTPRFFVFYNGTSNIGDKAVYKLSDMFRTHTTAPALELSVTVYNINEGHNKALLDACKTLKGYSIFVAKVRKYRQEAEDKYNSENPVPLKNLVEKEDVLKALISSAVSKAIDECIQENVLKDFFLTYRQEVINMSYSESTAEEQIEIISNYQYENGFNNGFSNGFNNGFTDGQKNLNELYAWLLSNNRSEDMNKAIQDPEYLAKLQEEYKSLVAAQ